MSLRIALAREGYQVDTASCGVEAMALIDQFRYDLVLLDLRLPDVSGIEVLRYARRHDPEVKVLLVTASTHAPSALEAAEEGAVGVVAKPFTLKTIAAATRRAIAGPSRLTG
ncbi:MAG: response regulator [Acidobacteriia bacterium]|nr:response regulator [Terriglobia bacterium]